MMANSDKEVGDPGHCVRMGLFAVVHSQGEMPFHFLVRPHSPIISPFRRDKLHPRCLAHKMKLSNL